MWLFQIIHVDSLFNWHVVGWRRIPPNRIGGKLCLYKFGKVPLTPKSLASSWVWPSCKVKAETKWMDWHSFKQDQNALPPHVMSLSLFSLELSQLPQWYTSLLSNNDFSKDSTIYELVRSKDYSSLWKTFQRKH